MKKMKYVLMTTSVMLLVGAASAELLGAWMDGSTDYTAMGLAPSVAPAVSGATGLNLTQNGLGWENKNIGFGGDNMPSGPTYDPGSPSWWSLIRSANTADNTIDNADYLGVRVVADAGKKLNMDTLTFDATLARNSAGTFTTTFGIYVSTDGGLNYNLFDSSKTLSHVDGVDPIGTVLAPTTLSYDISSFTDVEDFRVHIAFADNSDAGNKGTYLQGVQLNGTVIPEPATIGLLGMAAAGMMFIRRIMM